LLDKTQIWLLVTLLLPNMTLLPGTAFKIAPRPFSLDTRTPSLTFPTNYKELAVPRDKPLHSTKS
jgi:hypothetical protein